MTFDRDHDATIAFSGASAPYPVEAPLHVLSLLDDCGRSTHRYILGSEPLRIGRNPSCGLHLPASQVSRLHAEVMLSEGRAFLTDLASTNGCLLDGRRISGAEALSSGMRITIGPFSLAYLCGSRRDLERSFALEKDVERANRYLQALLPAPIAQGPVTTSWRFVPSANIGGDGFGYRWLDADCFAFHVVDVAGHGAGSALLAASVLNVLRDRAGPDPASVLTLLNDSFQMEEQGGLYFTIWYGVADLAARQLRFGTAGHHPGFLLAPAAAAPVALGSRSPPIGMMPAIRFTTATAPLAPNTRLLLFSDGLFESPDHAGRRATPGDVAAQVGPATAPREAEADRLLNLALARTRGSPFDDDVSILLLDFLPQGVAE